MMEVDISNIWGSLSLPDLLGLEPAVFDAHMQLTGDHHPLLSFPGTLETEAALLWAEEIRECSQVLVILGDNGFIRSAVDLAGQETDLNLLFVPGSFSSRSRSKLLRRLEGKPFSLCLCGEEAFWDTLLLRELKWILERRYGTDEAASRIHRDPHGLIAMAAGGVDAEKFCRGMDQAREELDLRAFDNPAWLYTASRYLLGQRGISAEHLIYTDPEQEGLARYWQALFSSGAPVPVPARIPRDPRQAAMITHLRFASEELSPVIGETVGDPGGVNFLAGQTLAQLEEQVCSIILDTATEGDLPALIIDCGIMDAESLGYLYRFFRLSAALWEKLSGQSGDNWEQQLLAKLGRPC